MDEDLPQEKPPAHRWSTLTTEVVNSMDAIVAHQIVLVERDAYERRLHPDECAAVLALVQAMKLAREMHETEWKRQR